MRKIQLSGQHLLGIINDILDFSKIEAGKLSIEQADFELEKLLDNVATLISEKAAAKGLELVFDVGRAVPQNLRGDSWGLEISLATVSSFEGLATDAMAAPHSQVGRDLQAQEALNANGTTWRKGNK